MKLRRFSLITAIFIPLLFVYAAVSATCIGAVWALCIAWGL